MQETNSTNEKQSPREAESPAIYVSSDRGLCAVKLILKDGFLLYKNAVKEKQPFFESGLLAAASYTSAPDGYFCTIKGGYSIKDHLGSGEVPDLLAFGRFTEAIGLLLEKCTEMSISIYDIIYDYGAVFTDKEFSDFKFIYMPGAGTAQGAQKCGELVKILFLHMYNVLSEEEYRVLGGIVEELSAAKTYETVFRSLQRIRIFVMQYCQNKKENAAEKLRDWLRKYARNNLFVSTGRKEPFKIDKRHEKYAAAPISGILIIQGRDRLSGIRLEKEIYKNKQTTIKIGRDREWADIYVEDIMASRHHAEICADTDAVIRIKDMSLNGTVVDETAIKNSEIKKTADTEIGLFITEGCALFIRYQTVLG